jgi:ethanolamine ammonia-lyase small subunit
VSEVDPKLLEKLGLFEVRSRATDKRVFLQRPDAGRALAAEARAELGRRCARAPPLQIVCGDGLSAVPLNEHLEPFLRALEQELAAGGVRAGTPFFVRYSRVKIMDKIARLLDAEACLFACGEGATDANREVISNINPRGIEPARAARLTAEAIARILRERKSGVAVQSGA